MTIKAEDFDGHDVIPNDMTANHGELLCYQ